MYLIVAFLNCDRYSENFRFFYLALDDIELCTKKLLNEELQNQKSERKFKNYLSVKLQIGFISQQKYEFRKGLDQITKLSHDPKYPSLFIFN